VALCDDADALVAGDERWGGLDRPVSFGGVDVGVAQTACFDLHAHLPMSERSRGDLLDGDWITEAVDYRGAVGGSCGLRCLWLGDGDSGHDFVTLS